MSDGAEQSVGQHVAQTVGHVAANEARRRVAVVTGVGEGVASEVGAALGDPTHVGHGVILFEQGRPHGPQLVGRQVGHWCTLTHRDRVRSGDGAPVTEDRA